MVSKTNEQALEPAIERALTGSCLEDHKGDITGAATAFDTHTHLGYVLGLASGFNAQYALNEQ